MNQSRRAFLKSSLAAASVPAAALAATASATMPDRGDDAGREPNHPDLEELALALHHALKMAELCLDATIEPGGEILPEYDLAGIQYNLSQAFGWVDAMLMPFPELQQQQQLWKERGY